MYQKYDKLELGMIPFGQALLLWRLERGLTQEALARRARIPRPNLSAIERGKREVSLRTLRALAAALGVRPGVLVDGVPPSSTEGRHPSSSRTTIERIADAVGFGRSVAHPEEQKMVVALRTLLGHRTSAIRRRRDRPRTSPRAAIDAWLTLTSCYSHTAIQNLADRVAQRQRVYGSPNH
jgi:transcriptional regulator with XRE-family HTH domain